MVWGSKVLIVGEGRHRCRSGEQEKESYGVELKLEASV